MKRAAALLGVVLFVVSLSSIAGTTASITGMATHDSAPVAGVEVTISSPAMQGMRTTTTDVNGRYAFVALPPGEYTVTFDLAEMQTASTSVSAGVGQTARADAALYEKRSEAKAEASAVAAAVETKSVQTNLSASAVDALPVGRDIASTVSLVSGATSSVASNLSSWLLDGGVTNDPSSRAPAAVYVEDAIQETAVLSGAIPAEYGRFQGGVVNSITRSGGNDWSGSFRDSFSNPSWTAPSPYQNIENTDELEQIFEATFGGRILRDQLWFFAAARKFDDTTQQIFARSPSWGFTTTRQEHRWQGKLTGELAGRHTFVASYLDKPLRDENYCYLNRCAEPLSIDPERHNDTRLGTVRYTGMFTSNLAAEAYWSGYESEWTGSGGDSTDLVTGTRGIDKTTGARFGAPTFSVRSEDRRKTRNYGVKATWFRATAGLGTHDFAVGYEEWSEDSLGTNYQSGSDFVVYTYSAQKYDLRPGDVFRPTISPGDLIGWWPIPIPDRPANKKIRGSYVNDSWSLGSNWSFNVGLRYDVNDLVDGGGTVVSDSSSIQPRLSASWDARGDGRYRLNASYARYADLIPNNITDAAFGGGSPMLLYWQYEGPAIKGLPTFDAFAKVFEWFNAQCDAAGNCGNRNMENLYWGSGGANGVRFGSSLQSPKVDEATLGFSMAVGPGAFIRADLMSRRWSDWIEEIITHETGQTEDIFGNPIDVLVYDNVDIGRVQKYDAVFLQGAYRFGRRWNLGGNANLAKRAAQNGDGSNLYPELMGFPQGHPETNVNQRSLRGWLTWELPTKVGTIGMSLLESFESGGRYGVRADISTTFDPAALASYAEPPQTATYWFENPDTLHWDNVTSTDVALRYQLPVRWSGAFVDFNVTNVFNESAQIGGDTFVSTWQNRNCRQTANPTKRCALFNPFTETPVEGVHYVKSATFGQPTSTSHYQTPRTYSFSAGLRF